MPYKLQVFAKGKQVQSYAVSSGDITDILIDQTMSLAPSASLLLYSVNTDNELIADEMAIFVSGLVKNQVYFEQKSLKIPNGIIISCKCI